MNYTAEGIKKMGILTTLIRNRELNTNTVLFMDEPENAMHPGALRIFVKHLIAMNKAGVQIFLTTHNYFVINQLQIEAKKEESKINCCSIEREERELKARFYDMANEIPENSIINEALAMFDEDIKETLKKQ
jgi:AAA15 family ATPase/GTPase